MFDNVQLEKVTAFTVAALKKEWTPYVMESTDLPEVQYRRIIEWGNSFVNGNFEEGTFFYALTCDGNNGAPSVLALMDLTLKHPLHAPKFAIKVMSIHTAPHFDLRQANTEVDNSITRKHKLSMIISEIIIGAINELFERDASEVKIYCSSQLSLSFFETVAGDMKSDLLSRVRLSVDLQGNWLVISKRFV
tara:strand:+ start:672 stop:1244 length:573 start_codon:yes stop_codon:yes gene_type:complete